jgi:antitoxin component HigA of HigAB toxin-antitoxin module
MQNLRRSKNITAEMVFAEQRLLAMCAKEKNIRIKSLLDANNLENQDCFTHVWGLKSSLQASLDKRRDFCVDCIKRIRADFPEEIPVLKRIESLSTYIKEIV